VVKKGTWSTDSVSSQRCTFDRSQAFFFFK